MPNTNPIETACVYHWTGAWDGAGQGDMPSYYFSEGPKIISLPVTGSKVILVFL
jgi:hypothetical protein